MDIVKEYTEFAKQYAEVYYGVTDSHITNIIASVLMTRDGVGIKGGSFVQSVVDNDLFQAISRADSKCYQHLKVIAAANKFAYLQQKM